MFHYKFLPIAFGNPKQEYMARNNFVEVITELPQLYGFKLCSMEVQMYNILFISHYIMVEFDSKWYYCRDLRPEYGGYGVGAP